MKTKKLASIFIILLATFTSFGATTGATALENNNLSQSISPTSTARGYNQPTGIKSQFVKYGLRELAKMIRWNSESFIYLAKKSGGLDAKAEKALRNNTSTVAKALEDISEIPDILTHNVRNEVYKKLSGPLGHGTANVIAGAVEGVLWIIL